MRTTVDLPDDLLQRAKMSALERGTSLRVLIQTALAKELGLGNGKRTRLEGPIFRSRAPGTLQPDESSLSRIDSEEDRRQNGLVR